ncbi:unnamed protein product, partial [Ectocarpus fasciculatus]
KPSHNDAKSLPLHIYVRVHCDYDTSSWREWLDVRRHFCYISLQNQLRHPKHPLMKIQ